MREYIEYSSNFIDDLYTNLKEKKVVEKQIPNNVNIKYFHIENVYVFFYKIENNIVWYKIWSIKNTANNSVKIYATIQALENIINLYKYNTNETLFVKKEYRNKKIWKKLYQDSLNFLINIFKKQNKQTIEVITVSTVSNFHKK